MVQLQQSQVLVLQYQVCFVSAHVDHNHIMSQLGNGDNVNGSVRTAIDQIRESMVCVCLQREQCMSIIVFVCAGPSGQHARVSRLAVINELTNVVENPRASLLYQPSAVSFWVPGRFTNVGLAHGLTVLYCSSHLQMQ